MTGPRPELFLAVSTNPAIDRVARFGGPLEGVVKAGDFLETPGGKAVHTAMVASRLGARSALITTAGGSGGRLLLDLLEDEAFPVLPVEVAGATRGTYTLVSETEADLIEVHEPSAPLGAAECDRLVGALSSYERPPAVVAVCGSLPTGSPADLHARLVAAARDRGDHTILDCSSPEALPAALAEGPDLFTPNLAEARRLLGADESAPIPADAELAELGARLLATGPDAVWLSLGPAGSLLATEGSMVRLSVPEPPRAVNAVGCGDALVGGLAAGLLAGDDLERAAALGVAAATEKLGHLHPGEVEPAAVERIRKEVGTHPVGPVRGAA